MNALSARQIRRGALSVHAHHHVVDADIDLKHGGSSFPEIYDSGKYNTPINFVKRSPSQLYQSFTRNDSKKRKLIMTIFLNYIKILFLCSSI